MVIRFILNDRLIETQSNPSTILLDFIRGSGLKGTKIGCREGDCGACAVLVGELREGEVNYRTYTSCLTSLIKVNGKHVVTIEGLGKEPTPIQLRMYEENATQCGFCTPGFVVSLTASSLNNTNAIMNLDGNICRCTGYKSIERAATIIQREYNTLEGDRDRLVKEGFVPKYFIGIERRLSQIQQQEADNDGGRLIGGGTDLYVQIPHQLVRSKISHLGPQLRYIAKREDEIEFGATTTMNDVLEQPSISNVLGYDKLRMIASTPIRNMATLAGNIVNASPIGDFTIILLALGATLRIRSDQDLRTIRLDEFYRGYKELDLNDREYIESITVPWRWDGFNFEKVSKRRMLDIASVNSAMAFRGNHHRLEEVRITAGGVFPYPLLLRKTSDFLTGKDVNTKTIKEALDIASMEIRPISDVRGSKEYKSKLLRNLILAHFEELFSDHFELQEVLS